MSILRYTASADNTITNAFQEDLATRGTGSSMGQSDILEIFSIYGQASTGSSEASRVLINFPISKIKSDRTSGKIPAPGSVNFILKMYNAAHGNTNPENFDLYVAPLSQSWDEGRGLDMENYTDLTYDKIGSNWINAKPTSSKATASITVSGTPTNALTMTITDVTGTSTVITSSAALGAGTATDTSFSNVGTPEQIRNAMTLAITNGSAGITATNVSTDKITLTQDTAGPLGDTAITNNLDNVTSDAKFSGGGRWTSVGGDFLTADAVTKNMPTGLEDLEIDVTTIVEKWILGSAGGEYDNYGFMIKYTNEYESYFSSSNGQNSGSVIHNPAGQTHSYYTKKFFGRGTEFFFARPVIEAQLTDQKKDNRGNFQVSSSVLPAANNKNKIYYYNYSQGQLVDIAGDSSIQPVVKLYYSSASVPTGDPRGFLRGSDNNAQSSISATRESTGVYYVEIAATSSIVTSTYPYLVDVWAMPDGTEFYTGSAITPIIHNPGSSRSRDTYVVSIKNLQRTYSPKDNVRFRTYIRKKNWSPSIYTVAQNSPQNLIIEDAIYKVERVVDNLEVIRYGTGSIKYSSLSYDSEGNYFDLDMSLFEKGYQYAIMLSFYDGYVGSYVEQPYKFKFRVDE